MFAVCVFFKGKEQPQNLQYSSDDAAFTAAGEIGNLLDTNDVIVKSDDYGHMLVARAQDIHHLVKVDLALELKGNGAAAILQTEEGMKTQEILESLQGAKPKLIRPGQR